MATSSGEKAFLSSDVALNVKLLVLNLHGSMPEMWDVADRPLSYKESLAKRTGVAVEDLHVICQLHAHGRPLGLPERTCNVPGSRLRWNEWLTFGAKYRDLSPDAWVELTVIGSSGPCASRTLGCARLELFTEEQHLRTKGAKVMLELTLEDADATSNLSKSREPRVALPLPAEVACTVEGGGGAMPSKVTARSPTAGGATPFSSAARPSAAQPASGSTCGMPCAADMEEMSRLEELAARHEEVSDHADRALDWLNRPTYAHLERRQQVSRDGTRSSRRHARVMTAHPPRQA